MVRVDPNATAEEIYEQLCIKAGLHGKAFHLHQASRKEVKKMSDLWKLALRTVAMREDKKREILKHVTTVDAPDMDFDEVTENIEKMGKKE